MPAAYSHALEAWAVQGLVLENFQGKSAREALPPLLLDGVPRTIGAREVLNSSCPGLSQ